MSVFISSNIVLNPSVSTPLTHARIGWHSIVTVANVSGTAGLTDYPITSLANAATYEKYKPDAASATINIDAGNVADVDYLAMMQKNVSLVQIYYSHDEIDYTLHYEYSSNGKNADMALFEPISARYWRVVINGNNMVVSAFKMGKALAMQRAIYSGHSPISLSLVTVNRPNLSQTGQLLGSSMIRKGYQTSFDWSNLKSAWYRGNFDLFVQSNPSSNPFFIAWRPETFPDEVMYCIAKGNVQPSNTGTKDFMSVSLQVEGFANVS